MLQLDTAKIARWYRCGLWTAKMLDEAIARGSLTTAQAEEIKAGGVTNDRQEC